MSYKCPNDATHKRFRVPVVRYGIAIMDENDKLLNQEIEWHSEDHPECPDWHFDDADEAITYCAECGAKASEHLRREEAK